MEFIFLNCARARLGYPSLPCAPARITFLKNDPFLKFPKFFLQHFVHFFFVLPSSKNINSVKIFFKKKERALHLWTDTKSQVNIYKKKNIHLYYVEKRSSPYNSPVSLTSWMIRFCLFPMQNAYRVFESSHNYGSMAQT